MAKLRLFDCNARIGTWIDPRPEHFTDADGLRQAMDWWGIDRALVHHALAWQWDPAEGNRILLDKIRGRDGLFPCLTALPPPTGEIGTDELVQACLELHGAVRFFPKDHNWQMAPWCAGELFQALEKSGVPAFVEVSQTTWSDIAATATAYPRMTLVLLNTSYRCNRYLYPLWRAGCDVRVCIETYMPLHGIAEVCRLFGPERLLFGTGLPERDPGGPIAMLQYSGIPDDQKTLIAAGNLEKLLKLDGA